MLKGKPERTPAEAAAAAAAEVPTEGAAVPAPATANRETGGMQTVASLFMKVKSFTKRPNPPRQCLRCHVTCDPETKAKHCDKCTQDMRDCSICSIAVIGATTGTATSATDGASTAAREVKALETVDGDVALCPLCTARRPTVQPPALTSRRKKNILSLDGGGLRGVFTLVILKRLCEVAGRPIRDLFDLIVGCSAGGVLACGLGILGFTADDGIDLFLAMGEEAFRKRENKVSKVADRIGAATGIEVNSAPAFSHKYQHHALEKVLMQHLGHDTMMISDSPKVALFALHWNVVPRRPVLFRSYDEPVSGAPLGGPQPGTFKAWEAARAAAAAPTYFRPFKIDDEWYADGGLAANNPSVAALSEATALYGIENINVLVNVGTGFKVETKVDIDPDPWIWNLATDVVLSCLQSQTVMVDTAMSGIIGDRYVQLNGPIEKEAMDDPKLLEAWVAEATRWCDTPQNREKLEVLAARLLSAE